MMCWLPSGFVEASTTEGEEYAFEVTHVQCWTKRSSMRMVFIMTGARAGMPTTRPEVEVLAFLVTLMMVRKTLPWSEEAEALAVGLYHIPVSIRRYYHNNKERLNQRERRKR